MAEVKKVDKTAESGGIRNVAPTPVLAEKALEPGEVPVEPPIKIAGLEALDVSLATELKEAGDTVVQEYQPTAEDLERLALSNSPSVPGFEPIAEPKEVALSVADRLSIIPASVASRTYAEMKRGKEITDAKTKMRRELLGQ